MASMISLFRPGCLCAVRLGKKQLMRLWRRQCHCVAKVSSDVHTARVGGVGFFPAETALSVVQSKKVRVILRAATAAEGAAFISTAAAASYFETADVEAKHKWGLNKEQLAVAEGETAYVRLVAGPGSGKTRVLTHRIAHMINNFNVPPRCVLTIADSAVHKHGTGQSALFIFLQEISFVSDQKNEMGEDGKNFVKLMTLHAAKGLEFDCVFISGLQEHLLPLFGKNVNEERRLFYVGVTRAMQRLYITFSASNIIEGEELEAKPSRFVHEIVNSEMSCFLGEES